MASEVEQRRVESDKMARARKALREIFGEDEGVIWNLHFKEDIRPYLVKSKFAYIFDNEFGERHAKPKT